MEVGGWILLALLWVLLNLMTKAKEKSRPPPKARPRPLEPDATQREGSRLEQILREFERALEEAPSEEPSTPELPRPGRPHRPQQRPLPVEEEYEDRRSLEVVPEIISLEGEVHREVRPAVGHDDQAEQIVARRIASAAARDTAKTRAEHLEFDRRIRMEPPDRTVTRRYSAQQLRDAVVWREILGPPVSLREDKR